MRDIAGRVRRVTDPLGRVTDTDYDLAGRKISNISRGIIPPLPAQPPTPLATAFEYDKASNLTASVNPRGTAAGGTTYRASYADDASNRTTAITEQTDGTTANDIVTRIGYDARNDTSVRDGRSANVAPTDPCSTPTGRR